ncbi:MAG: hypothetical protein Terrestrivirus2_73 [Terrestrivirus sp.]|uniref:Uncharacterized protein n=1 Tax=Terrestrivirus sp. TaxID=2487775 RepID=A0A3G4ZL54_9VIRU|nr:MAG: hypothetical protein Terrestrivirus2_73 [Terrestrivirus sp.]
MSGNFFLYDVNFFRGLRNVLRDMIKTLQDTDDIYYRVYSNAVKLYTNPALLELSRMYTDIHEMLLHDCDHYVQTYFARVGELKNISQLFVELFCDVNRLFESIRELYACNDVNVCDGVQYTSALNFIAFPCAPCVPKVRQCIETFLYPLAFVIWLISALGKLLSGCADVEVSMDHGLIFMMEMTSMTRAVKDFAIIGTTLKDIPRMQKGCHDNKHNKYNKYN